MGDTFLFLLDAYLEEKFLSKSLERCVFSFIMPDHLKIIKLSPNMFESFGDSSHFLTFVDICLLIVSHCDEFIIATPLVVFA